MDGGEANDDKEGRLESNRLACEVRNRDQSHRIHSHGGLYVLSVIKHSAQGIRINTALLQLFSEMEGPDRQAERMIDRTKVVPGGQTLDRLRYMVEQACWTSDRPLVQRTIVTVPMSGWLDSDVVDETRDQQAKW